MHPRSRNLLLTTAALLALGAAPAAGGPAGGTVVGGTATIQGWGSPRGEDKKLSLQVPDIPTCGPSPAIPTLEFGGWLACRLARAH